MSRRSYWSNTVPIVHDFQTEGIVVQRPWVRRTARKSMLSKQGEQGEEWQGRDEREVSWRLWGQKKEHNDALKRVQNLREYSCSYWLWQWIVNTMPSNISLVAIEWISFQILKDTPIEELDRTQMLTRIQDATYPCHYEVCISGHIHQDDL